jgi:hypothetical protein
MIRTQDTVCLMFSDKVRFVKLFRKNPFQCDGTKRPSRPCVPFCIQGIYTITSNNPKTGVKKSSIKNSELTHIQDYMGHKLDAKSLTTTTRSPNPVGVIHRSSCRLVLSKSLSVRAKLRGVVYPSTRYWRAHQGAVLFYGNILDSK